jgi:hypothetical protein
VPAERPETLTVFDALELAGSGMLVEPLIEPGPLSVIVRVVTDSLKPPKVTVPVVCPVALVFT